MSGSWSPLDLREAARRRRHASLGPQVTPNKKEYPGKGRLPSRESNPDLQRDKLKF